MNITSKMLDILIAISSLILITFCSACEKKIETRNKPEYGQNAVTVTDDLDQYKGRRSHDENYNIGQPEEAVEKRKSDFERSMRIKRSLEDGTLIDKYGGK